MMMVKTRIRRRMTPVKNNNGEHSECKSGPTDLPHYAQVYSPSLPPAHSPSTDTATHIADTITLAAGTAMYSA